MNVLKVGNSPVFEDGTKWEDAPVSQDYPLSVVESNDAESEAVYNFLNLKLNDEKRTELPLGGKARVICSKKED